METYFGFRFDCCFQSASPMMIVQKISRTPKAICLVLCMQNRAVLQGSGTGGKMAELNSRIQAKAAQPSPDVKNLPPPSKPLSAVARPGATFNSAQNSAALHSESKFSWPATLVVSHGMLQSNCGEEVSQRTAKYMPSCATATGGGAVQLVKLSGENSVSL